MNNIIKKLTKKQKILLIGLLIILGVGLIFGIYNLLINYNFNNKKEEDAIIEKEEIIDNDLYNYKISNRATTYEKELFNELKTIVKEDVINDENYASTLTKIFITDLFTLKNKKSSSDVRSSQYVYNDYQETFKLMVKESIYANIELDFDGTREQKLPVVKNVIINTIVREPFSFNDTLIDNEAFNINTTIEYEEDMGYPINYNVVLVKKDKVLQVVKAGI